MNGLRVLSIGQSAGNDPHKVTNAVVSGLPELAHVANPDHSVQQIIDNNQSVEAEVTGVPRNVAGIVIPSFHAVPQQIWQNFDHKTVMMDVVPIPWLEG